MRGVRGWSVAVGMIAVLALGGCASTPTPEESQRQAMQPTATPSPAVVPIGDPRDTREISGKGFRLAADSAFQQIDRTSANGEPMLVLRKASQQPALPIQLAVLREPDPKQDVIEQSYALEVSKRSLGEADQVTRSELAWPDAERAVLVQWTEKVTIAGTTVPTRYWQLNLQVNPKLILAVVGFAPAAEFDDSTVGDLIRTFRVRT